MNILSLSFSDQTLEYEYQKENTLTYRKFQNNQKWLVLPLILFQIVMRALKQDWLTLTVLLICTALYIINIKLTSNNKYLRDVLLFLLLVGYNFFCPYNTIFQTASQYSYSIDGFFQAVASLALINLLSYIKKLLTLTVLFIFQVTMFSNPNLQFWEQFVLYFLQLLLYMQYCYCCERFKRQAFIQATQHSILEENIQNSRDIESFIIDYNVSKNKISLMQKNRTLMVSQKMQDEFVDKIRNCKVSHYDSKRRMTQFNSQELLEPSGLMSLEMFLYYLFSNKLNYIRSLLQQDHQQQDQYLFKGYLYSESYTVKVVKLYSDKPCALVLLIENKKDNVIEQLNLRNKIAIKALDQISDIFRDLVKPSLIQFHWIYAQKNKSKNIAFINKLLRKINSNVLRCYNEYCNIQDYFSINQVFQRCLIQKFDFKQFLNHIIQDVINFYGDEKGIFFQIECNLPDPMVRQDQRQLKQLFLNLFFFILGKGTQEPNLIRISLNQEKDDNSHQKSIKVRIDYHGHHMTKAAMNSLPIINPQSITELIHNSQKAFDLLLPISLLIMRKIGPYDKLTLRQTRTSKNYMEFFIFNSLEENYHLLPIISFYPKDNIVTNSSLTKRYSEYLDQYPQLNSIPEMK